MDSSTVINLIVIILVIWFVYTRFGPTKGLRTLKEGEFRKEIENSPNKLLVDVREPGEFKGGFIPGARNIPLSQINGRLAEIPKDRDVLLYCRSGMRSKNAARILRKNGYTKLAHLQGGIGAWGGKLSK
ncbi:rhodanese-like domain-containing protein [Paenibacillus alginolyticus]|uniref:Rhodanese-like domain-containing protein n=1 Tax=Paenibacillus alginolyticus TaxID=59839 RepID=A0ABT4GDG8_9BACL|nr:rhodanese-like domain-containing protein [Paenibacillus alginolyticus]MCY9694212.1 rhodanese-like domain-containing protein [Paenibacillus alginolyticus]MEC0142762.1 rhodanese-like domain-containing protein [Paenibacillus alginolyticus]